VLAVFPHLPQESEMPPEPAGAPTEANTAAFVSQAAPAAPAAVATETTAAHAPEAPEAFSRTAASIRRLTTAAREATPPVTSFLVGLENLAAAHAPAEMQAALPAPAAAAPALTRSQWPTGIHAPPHLSWAAPAAPYLGASPLAGPPALAPVPPLIPAPIVREAADLAQAALSWPAGFSPLAAPVPAATATGATETPAGAPAAEAARPEVPARLHPEVFDETTEEVGAAEANDLSAPEDDLTPNEPAENATLALPALAAAEAYAPAPAAPAAAPEPVHTARTPPLDGLNFRMIQYARQAAQLVRDRADFGVIYAPTWPAWLAALEIRNSSRRPLVLYAASLAADFAGPAERGWLLEVERMALRRAHLILVPNEQVRRQLRRHYGSETGEVRVVPAADEDAVQALLQGLATG